MKAVPELIGRGADLLQPGLSVRTSMLLGSRGDFQKIVTQAVLLR